MRNEYGSFDDFLKEFNPDTQVTLVESGEDLWLTGDFPTLAIINTTYGQSASVQWLIAQLYNLSEFCGFKEKFTKEQIYESARIINAEYYYLKVSELQKFFFDMKGGHYGKFYGFLDPMVVTSGLVKFLEQRRNKLGEIELEKEREERRRKEEESARRAISYEEYLRRKAATRKSDDETNAEDTAEPEPKPKK